MIRFRTILIIIISICQRKSLFRFNLSCDLEAINSQFQRYLLNWKRVESTSSLVEQLLPESIHAVKARGFELKIVRFVLVCRIRQLFRQQLRVIIRSIEFNLYMNSGTAGLN